MADQQKRQLKAVRSATPTCDKCGGKLLSKSVLENVRYRYCENCGHPAKEKVNRR